MFLKSFPTFIITIYPLLLLEFLTTLNPSLPPYRFIFFRTFLLKLDYNLIHTNRNSCEKTDMKQLCRVQGSSYVSESKGKMFLSSQLTKTAWNTNTCSIHHWTRRCSTEEEWLTDKRKKRTKIAVLREAKEDLHGIKCSLPPCRWSVQSRTKEKPAVSRQPCTHWLVGCLARWNDIEEALPLWRLSERSAEADGKNIFQRDPDNKLHFPQ